MTYADRKRLGLILTAADRLEANQIAAEIREHGGSAARWDRADRTPALSAEVHNLISDSASGHVTPAHQLEQFYRYRESGLSRGGKVWTRPSTKAERTFRITSPEHGPVLWHAAPAAERRQLAMNDASALRLGVVRIAPNEDVG